MFLVLVTLLPRPMGESALCIFLEIKNKEMLLCVV